MSGRRLPARTLVQDGRGMSRCHTPAVGPWIFLVCFGLVWVGGGGGGVSEGVGRGGRGYGEGIGGSR